MMPLPATREGSESGQGTERFEEALARLRGIVGEAHVRADPDSVARYSRDTIPWRRVCAAVVVPGTAEEVREVVKVAAEFRLPLWPFSKGKNWGYGATMACHDGAIVLLLERLNRILEVNEELAYAVIEPGVTQGQLNAHLKATGSKLWADVTDSSPEGSVLGNALERGVGYTSYGDHFGHLCGLEVVLPNGDLVRTGAGPQNAQTWHTYKYGTGPYLEGLFSQSGLGILVKAGVWLMPEPEAFNGYFFQARDDKDLPAIIDAIRRLALGRAVQSNVHMVNDFLFLTLLTQYPAHLLRPGETCLSEDALAGLRRELGVAPWSLTGGLYGSAAQVRASRDLIRRELSPYGSLTFLDDAGLRRAQWLIGVVKKFRDVPVLSSLTRWLMRALTSSVAVNTLEVIPHVYPILKGVPGEFIVSCAYFKSRRERVRTDVNPGRDGCGLMWFAPVVPLTGRHVSEVLDICRPLFQKHGIDFSLSFILVNPRSVVMLMEIFFDKESPDETARAAALFEALSDQTIRAGYQQYRTSVHYMDRILAEAPEYRRLAESLKRALDPDNILAPGRYGVGLP
jgi:4-cresol dehydrogenase (hydroxylating)